MTLLSRPKFWIYALLGVIVVGVGASLWIAKREVRQAEEAARTINSAAQSEIVGEQVTFAITENHRKKWDLLVQRARYFKDRSRAQLQGVSGMFYDAQGKPVARFEAPAGETQQAGKRVRLTGGVKVSSVSETDNALWADSLTWPIANGGVEATGRVKVKMAGGATSSAQRCRFSLDFSQMTLEGDVRSLMDI